MTAAQPAPLAYSPDATCCREPCSASGSPLRRRDGLPPTPALASLLRQVDAGCGVGLGRDLPRVRLVSAPSRRCSSSRTCAAGMRCGRHGGGPGCCLGAGSFQLYDGTVQHKLLRLHQIRYDVDLAPYDWTWNIHRAAHARRGRRAADPLPSRSACLSTTTPGTLPRAGISGCRCCWPLAGTSPPWCSHEARPVAAGGAPCCGAPVGPIVGVATLAPLANTGYDDITIHMVRHLLVGMLVRCSWSVPPR
jgi:hypothetical protein